MANESAGARAVAIQKRHYGRRQRTRIVRRLSVFLTRLALRIATAEEGGNLLPVRFSPKRHQNARRCKSAVGFNALVVAAWNVGATSGARTDLSGNLKTCSPSTIRRRDRLGNDPECAGSAVGTQTRVSSTTWSKTIMLEGQILTWDGVTVWNTGNSDGRAVPRFSTIIFGRATRYEDPAGSFPRIRNGVEKWVLREAMVTVLRVNSTTKKIRGSWPARSHRSGQTRPPCKRCDHWPSSAVHESPTCSVLDYDALSRFLDDAWKETTARFARS